MGRRYKMALGATSQFIIGVAPGSVVPVTPPSPSTAVQPVVSASPIVLPQTLYPGGTPNDPALNPTSVNNMTTDTITSSVQGVVNDPNTGLPLANQTAPVIGYDAVNGMPQQIDPTTGAVIEAPVPTGKLINITGYNTVTGNPNIIPGVPASAAPVTAVLDTTTMTSVPVVATAATNPLAQYLPYVLAAGAAWMLFRKK